MERDQAVKDVTARRIVARVSASVIRAERRYNKCRVALLEEADRLTQVAECAATNGWDFFAEQARERAESITCALTIMLPPPFPERGGK